MAYVFQPYPMRVTTPDGKRIRVLNEREHDRLKAEWGQTPPAQPEPVSVVDNALLAPATAVEQDNADTPAGPVVAAPVLVGPGED